MMITRSIQNLWCKVEEGPNGFWAQIKEFAEIIGVTEDTVINWKLRGMRPLRKEIKNRADRFIVDNFA
jgi:hypothetical protein